MRRHPTLGLVFALVLLLVGLGVRACVGSSTGDETKKNTANTASPGEPTNTTRAVMTAPAVASGAPVAPSASASNNRIALAPWGGESPDQVGHSLPSEGNPEGPMSLVSAGPGRFAVLDQVNGRVTLWSADGKAKTLLKLSGPLAADLAVGRDGSVAVLDRLGNKSVSLFDRDGNPLGVLPLEETFGDPGQMTGVFVDGDDVLVEKAHGPLVRVGSLKGDAHKG